MTASNQKTVFVTVGTTKFDNLIRAVDSRTFAAALKHKGFTHLLVQKGNGTYSPSVLLGPGMSSGTTVDGLYVEFFDYASSLAQMILSSALVISHAGSGSIFETLTVGVPLIVVPNPLLMDNHQQELGHQLEGMRHLVCASPDGISEAVLNFDASVLQPFVKGSAAGIASRLDALMGFQ
ncbi:MAG: hypothetical protein WDW38_005393 [Sanguina aurantia]